MLAEEGRGTLLQQNNQLWRNSEFNLMWDGQDLDCPETQHCSGNAHQLLPRYSLKVSDVTEVLDYIQGTTELCRVLSPGSYRLLAAHHRQVSILTMSTEHWAILLLTTRVVGMLNRRRHVGHGLFADWQRQLYLNGDRFSMLNTHRVHISICGGWSHLDTGANFGLPFHRAVIHRDATNPQMYRRNRERGQTVGVCIVGSS
ncbi:hypothetical protein BD779DRAFT_323242 [Infundibulicybe gibba]|nr:hypothetical protein BD779DRAFT_323242 [Infundibulicybe gibba]